MKNHFELSIKSNYVSKNEPQIALHQGGHFTPSSKVEPAIWSRDTGHIWHTWRRGRTDGRSHGDAVAKTTISRIDGLAYFLNHGA